MNRGLILASPQARDELARGGQRLTDVAIIEDGTAFLKTGSENLYGVNFDLLLEVEHQNDRVFCKAELAMCEARRTI